MSDLCDALLPAERAWVDAVALEDRIEFLAAFSGAARALGKRPVAVGSSTWGVDEIARAALVIRAGARIDPGELYARGDNRERQAVLKALPFLESPERFVALAVDACRLNVIPVFEAIACDNPFPALYFSELAFNQMVLKAAFNGIGLVRIVGLESRLNAELSRMANDYASERRAAGRSVPDDLGLVTKGITP